MQLPLQITFRDMEPSEAVEANIRFDASAYGLTGRQLAMTTITPEGSNKTEVIARRFERMVKMEPGKVWAWEITPL